MKRAIYCLALLLFPAVAFADPVTTAAITTWVTANAAVIAQVALTVGFPAIGRGVQLKFKSERH